MLKSVLIDGEEYFKKADVLRYFQRSIYREDVKRAIKVIRGEIHMRKTVFKNDVMQRERKVKEMEGVLRILCRTADNYPEISKSMFGG